MAVKVCVWSPTIITNTVTGERHSNIGHASMQLGGQYLSFWPLSAEFSVIGALKYVDSGFQNFDQDRKAESGFPDLVTVLKNLDENRISTFIQRMFSEKPRYHVKFFNCSHPVKIALYEGTGRKISPNFKVYADPGGYNVGHDIPALLKTQKVEDWIRQTWNPWNVDDYAKQLLKQVG